MKNKFCFILTVSILCIGNMSGTYPYIQGDERSEDPVSPIPMAAAVPSLSDVIGRFKFIISSPETEAAFEQIAQENELEDVPCIAAMQLYCRTCTTCSQDDGCIIS